MQCFCLSTFGYCIVGPYSIYCFYTDELIKDRFMWLRLKLLSIYRCLLRILFFVLQIKWTAKYNASLNTYNAIFVFMFNLFDNRNRLFYRITGCPVEQELPTIPEHPYSPSVLSGVRVARSLVYCVVFCRSAFALLYFFFRPLCCLFFDLRILINPLVFFQTELKYTWLTAVIIFYLQVNSIHYSTCSTLSTEVPIFVEI